MKLTDQQQKILDVFNRWENIVINAFAGAGKTTILKILAENNPDKEFLVFCFNKKNANELKAKMPSNVKSTTMHSFAYNLVKPVFGRNFKIGNDGMFIKAIKDYFNLKIEVADFFKSLFDIYCNQAWNLDLRNIIDILNSENSLYHMFRELRDDNFDFKYLITTLLKIKENIESGRFNMTHSYYLKYLQLNFEKIANRIPAYDVIMLDEAQDSNPVFLDFFHKIPWQKIVVWDKHQAIYGWRYAINAMDLFDYHKLYSSYSFRFIPSIAKAGNHILKNYKNETETLKSFFRKIEKKDKAKTAIIFRTNWGILEYIDSLSDDDEVNFLRNIDHIFELFLKIEAVKKYYLGVFDRIDDPYLRMVAERYKSWNLFKHFFLCSNKIDFISAIKIVERFNIYYLKKKAKELHNPKADIILTTAHVAKWSEFDKVIIYDDFTSMIHDFLATSKWLEIPMKELLDMFYDENNKYDNKKFILWLKESFNLIYVAITRAKHTNTIYSENVKELLDMNKKEFCDLLFSIKY